MEYYIGKTCGLWNLGDEIFAIEMTITTSSHLIGKGLSESPVADIKYSV